MTKTEFTEHEQRIMATIIEALQDKYAKMIILAATQALANKNEQGELLPIPDQLATIIGGGMRYLAKQYNFKADCDAHFNLYMGMMLFVIDEKLYQKPKGLTQ